MEQLKHDIEELSKIGGTEEVVKAKRAKLDEEKAKERAHLPLAAQLKSVDQQIESKTQAGQRREEERQQLLVQRQQLLEQAEAFKEASEKFQMEVRDLRVQKQQLLDQQAKELREHLGTDSKDAAVLDEAISIVHGMESKQAEATPQEWQHCFSKVAQALLQLKQASSKADAEMEETGKKREAAEDLQPKGPQGGRPPEPAEGSRPKRQRKLSPEDIAGIMAHIPDEQLRATVQADLEARMDTDPEG